MQRVKRSVELEGADGGGGGSKSGGGVVDQGGDAIGGGGGGEERGFSIKFNFIGIFEPDVVCILYCAGINGIEEIVSVFPGDVFDNVAKVGASSVFLVVVAIDGDGLGVGVRSDKGDCGGPCNFSVGSVFNDDVGISVVCGKSNSEEGGKGEGFHKKK
eukprot:389960_1